MNELYHERAGEYAALIKDNIYNALYDRPSLLALVEGQRFESCLDMGCGPGAYIPSLKKFCGDITAIDQSPKFVEMLRADHPDVNAYVGDISEGLSKESDASFDLVISPLTIHYIKDLTRLFKEVHRVLKNGGTFAFSTHHPSLDFQDSDSGNYFDCEYLTQVWNTLGDKTQVSFYRRPLEATMNALFDAGFVVTGLSEGKPSEKIKEISEEHYAKLTSKPQFLFVKANKA